MAVSKYRTCVQTHLPAIMFNYYMCLYNTVCERNGNNICLNYLYFFIRYKYENLSVSKMSLINIMMIT